MPVEKMFATGLALAIGAATLVTTADARHRWNHYHHGEAFAAGALGFTAGALIGGAFAGPRYGYYDDDYPAYYYDEPEYYAPRTYYRTAPRYYGGPCEHAGSTSAPAWAMC